MPKKINATGNPGCTLFNSECTISAGNTLRIGPVPYRTKISRRAPRSFSSSKWRRLLLLVAVSSDCFADDAAGAYTAADCTDANLMLTD